MTLNDSENRLAEDIVRLIDMASRVLNAVPGFHCLTALSRWSGISSSGLV